MSLAGPQRPGDGDAARSRNSVTGTRHSAARERLSAVDPLPERNVAAAAEPADDAPPPDTRPFSLDPGLDVRPLDRLRPVPPPVPPPPAARALPPPGEVPLGDLPLYDPYSARRRRTPEWLVSYVAWLVVVDLVAAGLGILAAWRIEATGSRPLAVVALGSVLLWPVLLALLGTYAERRLGTGFDEYRRVVDAGLVALAGLGALAALMPGAGWGRLIVVAVPIGTVCTLLGRIVSRRHLHRARRRGLMVKRAVVVGADAGVLDLVRRLRRDPSAGLSVVGTCVPAPAASADLVAHGVPVLGTLDDVLTVVDSARADAVLVAAATQTSGQYLRDLAWRLEGTNIELLLGPGVIEVAPNRLQVRPTTSMPLIRIQEPEFRGARRLVKELVDRLAAVVLLVLLSPFLIAIVLAIRLSSRGPALYRQRRIGKRGREFDLLKFRSMTEGAEELIDALFEQNEGNEVQFKLRQDPRVTRVGYFLRRYSLDELPQLVNVLKGDMSLVGPRPHVTREVALYGPDMQRRLLVKPGITGLWQVSGRSNLTWDEAVELDVRYVENWSIGLDLIILWQTLRAVLRKSGAY